MASDLQQWLIQEALRNQAYHNHKETMAWTATAFYIPGIIALGYKIPKISECWLLLVASVLLIGVGVLVGFFVHFQFYNRWIATDRVAGLIRTIGRLSSGWIPPIDEQQTEQGKLYPKFVEAQIVEAKGLAEKRWQVEWISYAAIALSTILAIGLILWKYYSPSSLNA